jgi:hypothetical protein
MTPFPTRKFLQKKNDKVFFNYFICKKFVKNTFFFVPNVNYYVTLNSFNLSMIYSGMRIKNESLREHSKSLFQSIMNLF